MVTSFRFGFVSCLTKYRKKAHVVNPLYLLKVTPCEPVDLGIKLIKRKLYEVVKICAVDIPRALRNGNWLWILDSRSTAQEALLRVVFALNRDYFPRVKDAEWLILSMTHVPKGFLKGISEYAREPDIRKARKMLINLTKDLISLVEQIWPQAIDGDTVTWLDRLSEDVIPVLD